MDKTNTEDSSNSKNGTSTIRDSLVISETGTSKLKKRYKRSRDNSSERSDDDDDSSDSSRNRKRSKKAKKLKKLKKKSKKAKKLKYHSDSSRDSDSCKKEKRKKKDKRKSKKRSLEKLDSSKLGSLKTHETNPNEDESLSFGPAIPDEIENKSRAMVPMTKEEWEKQQSRVRRVYDSESGRHRLVRGDGEIIEECVSRDRHRQINKQATAADGLFFQMNMTKK